MAGRQTLRQQQLAAAERACATAHQLVAMSDPERAREMRAAIMADVDAAVEIIETLARVEA